MDPYEAPDLYRVDEMLDDEERQIRDTVRSFVSEKVMPVIEHHFDAGTFPKELIPEIGELGLLGANLEGYGCAGVSSTAYGLMMQELERGDSGVRSFVSVQGSLVMYPIHTFGSDEQKEQWLPAMATGEKIGCFGLTEPDHGSDPSGMETRAVADGDEFVLNGTKRWITNGSISHVAIVWAKLDGQVRGFLVETDRPGFTARDIPGKWSLRASVTSELIMEDVRIPKSNLLPKSDGLKSALMCLNSARFGIAFGAVGAAQACFDEALRYAKARTQFDKPLAAFQLVQNKLVWMVNEITKGQLLALRLGRMKDAGTVKHYQISLAKRNNVWMALESARKARDILGASGVTYEYHCGRHMANLESVYTYEGTHDIHALIVGQQITGSAAFA